MAQSQRSAQSIVSPSSCAQPISIENFFQKEVESWKICLDFQKHSLHPIQIIIPITRYSNKIDLLLTGQFPISCRRTTRTLLRVTDPTRAHHTVNIPVTDSARKCAHVIVKDTRQLVNADLHNRIIIKYKIYDGDTVPSETIQLKPNIMIKSRTLSVAAVSLPPQHPDAKCNV